MNFVFRFKFNVLAVVAASLFTLTGVLPARAAWVDTFDGGFDQTWTFVAYDTALNTVGILPDAGATFSAGVVSDQLTFSDTLSRNDVGGSRYAFGSVNETFGDQRMTAILNPGNGSTDNFLMLFARNNGPGTGGYTAGLNFRNQELQITDLAGGELESVDLSTYGWTQYDSVYLEFDLIGNVLKARAYDAPGGSLYTEITYTDTLNLYSSGISGVFTSVGRNGTMNAVWDNVSAQSTSIPEPSSAALVAALGGAMAFRRRR